MRADRLQLVAMALGGTLLIAIQGWRDCRGKQREDASNGATPSAGNSSGPPPSDQAGRAVASAPIPHGLRFDINQWNSDERRYPIHDGTVSVRGPLTVDAVKAVVRRNRGRLRLCYEHALRQSPGMGGGVTLSFEIDGEGTAVQGASRASGDLHDPALVACLLGQLQRMAFPAHDGGKVRVEYALTFEDRSAEDASAQDAVPEDAARE